MHRTRLAWSFGLVLGSWSLVSGCSGGGVRATGSGGASAASTSSSSKTGTGGASTSSGSGGSTGTGGGAALEAAIKSTNWVKLAKGPTVPAPAKQDDIFFLDAMNGFVASGPNEAIYATKDGGMTWSKAFTSSGTYFRSLLFTDAQHGFAGNIGAGLSPSISDATLIYATTDGGNTWAPVTTISGTAAQGICNFTAVDATHLFAVGRANLPAAMLTSSDGGATWTTVDLSSSFSMVIDAHFFSATEGLVAGMDTSMRYCTIQRTTDGGQTFNTVFTSKTTGSLCWKLHFPSAQVGYAAVQDTASGPGTFAKTTDGGQTWKELPLPALAKPTTGYSAIGVGFLTEDIGWMASEDATQPAYRTFDGGMTWEVDPALKSPINRFRFVDAHTAYAVGGAVWKLVIPGN